MEGRRNVSISVLSKTYQITCNASDVEDLQASADILNKRITALHGEKSLAIPNIERLVIADCLNLIQELNEVDERLAKLESLLADLAPPEQQSDEPSRLS